MIPQVFRDSFANGTPDGRSDVGGHDEESHSLACVGVWEHIGDGGGDVGYGGGAGDAGEEAEDNDLGDAAGEGAANVEYGVEETGARVYPSATRDIPACQWRALSSINTKEDPGKAVQRHCR